MTSVEWKAGKVRFIDQTKLPGEEIYIETSDYRVVGEAIKRLQIRGAPAIGVAAAFAAVLSAESNGATSTQELQETFSTAVQYLSQTRPTAVNLFAALNRMRRVLETTKSADIVTIRSALLQEARAIQSEDVEACAKIGEYGASLIHPTSSILTHCNTGALATAGDGTAQSIITRAAQQNKIVQVFVDETRPLFQGARLTSWELMKHGIEVVLITDSTAGTLFQQRKLDAVIVGADRIAANGDVANKIGTYPLAVLAHYHGVPFYVAAPTSSIDYETASGENIPIEEREPREITHVGNLQIAPAGVKVFAPSFDITPNHLITSIVTEYGVLKPPYKESIEALKRHRVGEKIA